MREKARERTAEDEEKEEEVGVSNSHSWEWLNRDHVETELRLRLQLVGASFVRSLTARFSVVHRELQHGVHTKRIGSRALSPDYKFPDEFRAFIAENFMVTLIADAIS